MSKTDYELLRRMLAAHDTVRRQPSVPGCSHKYMEMEDQDGAVCEKCGIEMPPHLSHDKEWPGTTRSRKKGRSDTARPPARPARSLLADIDNEKFPFERRIKIEADRLFKIVIKGLESQTLRRKVRAAIQCGCLYYAIQADEASGRELLGDIRKYFDLTPRDFSQGMETVYQAIHRLDKRFQPTSRASRATPMDHIPHFLRRLEIDPRKHESKIAEIYDEIRYSPSLKRVYIKSVTAALIHYYCCSIGKPIDPTFFRERVNTTSHTYMKVVRIIDKIRGTNYARPAPKRAHTK